MPLPQVSLINIKDFCFGVNACRDVGCDGSFVAHGKICMGRRLMIDQTERGARIDWR